MYYPMYCTNAVLKLRSNYLQEITHLKSNVARLGLQANSCLSEQEGRIRKLHLLESYQKKCRDTLGKASRTLSSLNAAFRRGGPCRFEYATVEPA